jgi:hypothetical protein
MQILLWVLAIYLMYKLLVFNFLATLGFELILYQWFKITERNIAVIMKNIYYFAILFDLCFMVWNGVYLNMKLFFIHLGIIGLTVGVLMGSGEAMEKYINGHAQKRPWE